MEKYEKLTWKDYMGLSIRTLSKLTESQNSNNSARVTLHDLVDDEEVSTLSMTLDRVHCAMGVVSETQELVDAIKNDDIINIGEEIADHCWYLSNLLYIGNNYQIDYSFNFEFVENRILNFLLPMVQILVLHECNHYIIDSAKKELAYGKENQINHIMIADYLEKLMTLSNHYNLDMHVILAKNINKLYVRYPDKFTSENAIYKNIANERKEL